MGRRGSTLVEVVVAIAIILVLILLLLPAVLASRDVAGTIQCKNNLRQIALGLLNYHNESEMFPPGITSLPRAGGAAVPAGWSWLAFELPWVEQATMSRMVVLDGPIEAPENLTVRVAKPRTFLCGPADPGPELHRFEVPGIKGGVEAARSSYVGNFGTGDPTDFEASRRGDGVFFRDRAIRLDDILDGTSTTFLVGERRSTASPTIWAGLMGATGAVPPLGSTLGDPGPNAVPLRRAGFSSLHEGGSMFAFGDGAVRFVKDSIGTAVYHSLATRKGGEALEDWGSDD